MKRVSSRNRRNERGGTLVETSLILLPLILLIVGICVGAHAVFAYNHVAWMAQEGARWASVRGASSGRAATTTDIATFAKTKAAGLIASAVNVTATFEPDNKPGSRVTVDVSYTVTPLASGVWSEPLTVRSVSSTTVLQ